MSVGIRRVYLWGMGEGMCGPLYVKLHSIRKTIITYLGPVLSHNMLNYYVRILCIVVYHNCHSEIMQMSFALHVCFDSLKT